MLGIRFVARFHLDYIKILSYYIFYYVCYNENPNLFPLVCRSLFIQAIVMLPKIFRLNWLDAGVWCLTFLVVVLVDTLWGLCCGVLLALIYVFQQSSAVHMDVIGRLELKRTGYISIESHPEAVEIPGIRILRIYSNLNFSNVLSVKANVEKMSGIDLLAVSKIVAALKKAKNPEEIDRLDTARNDMLTVTWKASSSIEETCRLKCIVLDLNMVKSCDLPSVNTLNGMKQAYANVDVLFIPISESLISLTPVSHIGEAIKIWEDRTVGTRK